MMYWESWSDFWQMGRHGFYVWSCVLIVFVLISAELWGLSKGRREAMKKLQRLDLQENNLPPANPLASNQVVSNQPISHQQENNFSPEQNASQQQEVGVKS